MLEREQLIADLSNRQDGNLPGLDCPQCRNRGYFHRVRDNGSRYVEECDCMPRRRATERIRRSGLEDLVSRYSMDRWQTQEAWQAKAKALALEYAAAPAGWFVMTGSVGAGKTHLCVALCGLLLQQGMDVRYCMWRDFSVRAKAVVGDGAAYCRLVEPLKQAKVLYIDDLLKVGKGQQPTTGDVNLAFELLNARYNNAQCVTILSSERSLAQLMDIDEAVGSRIYERAKKYYLPLDDRKNWRLTGG